MKLIESINNMDITDYEEQYGSDNNNEESFEVSNNYSESEKNKILENNNEAPYENINNEINESFDNKIKEEINTHLKEGQKKSEMNFINIDEDIDLNKYANSSKKMMI